MSDEVYVRISPVLAAGGTFLQRHVFTDLDGKTAEAKCSHLAYTAQLQDDNPNIPLCPGCLERHGHDVIERDGLDVVEILDLGPEWALC
jgi:hypothetical protein